MFGYLQGNNVEIECLWRIYAGNVTEFELNSLNWLKKNKFKVMLKHTHRKLIVGFGSLLL